MSKKYIEFPIDPAKADARTNIRECLNLMGIRHGRSGVRSGLLPFAPGDVTAGSESEMQTVVAGLKRDVDLPQTIEASNYLSNIRRRVQSGDASARIMMDLEKYLQAENQNVWENSWVRFPLRKLGKFARTVLDHDLSKDKKRPELGKRSDVPRFLYRQHSEEYLRIPVSYLLKLALADLLDSPQLADPLIQQSGRTCMDKFQNDNTSPETSSLYIIAPETAEGIGGDTAREMSIRYLLGQTLLEYANQKFGLRESGQDVLMFFSPHPPMRQKLLSRSISDSFYRELFMNPCLSGWDAGEEKSAYMHLCHRVLSRSQVNAVLKLREAGIITSNLVSLPNLSNISLANNGTHVSLGSSKLGALLGDSASGFKRHHEKYLGDLVVKIVEHFLPLFVGTYTAAPYRLAFTDFHPENALGFLPHELDYTHLRMLWRRWKKKADLGVFGYKITPFGPARLDRFISKVFALKGDFVFDFRLLDYLVALMSTDESPALDGRINNSHRLKRDLADLGVFDEQMSLYLLDKLREFGVMGFSGFEARHYSLFESFGADMAHAVNLQNLLYLLAFTYIASGRVHHADIPDDPFVESERRQILFGRAIGLPTFFVHRETGNTFLKSLLEKTGAMRSSRRYKGYVRVYHSEYCRALLDVLRREAGDLIEMLNLKETLLDLECRIADPDHYAASGKITHGILGSLGSRSAMSVPAERFNAAAEEYYRTTLRAGHVLESFSLLNEAFESLEQNPPGAPGLEQSNGIRLITAGNQRSTFLNTLYGEFSQGKSTIDGLEKLAGLILIYVAHAGRRYANHNKTTLGGETPYYEASVY